MSILASKIVDRCNSFLDAEGSDRYTFDRDYIFAINSSIEWITEVINSVYSITKFPSEYLRELTKIRVFRTSDLSRIYINIPNETVWNINSVHPKALFRAINNSISATATEGENPLLNDNFETNLDGWTVDGLVWTADGISNFEASSGKYSIGSMTQNNLVVGQSYTVEFDIQILSFQDGLQVAINGTEITLVYDDNNVAHVSETIIADTDSFEVSYVGNIAHSFVIPSVKVRRVIPTTESALYYNAVFTGSSESCQRKTVEDFYQRNKNIFQAGSDFFAQVNGLTRYAYLDYLIYNNVSEIEIAPNVKGEAVAISYLKEPTKITQLSSNIEFPETLTDLFVKKTLSNIAIKIGDVNLSATMDKEVNNILKQLV